MRERLVLCLVALLLLPGSPAAAQQTPVGTTLHRAPSAPPSRAWGTTVSLFEIERTPTRDTGGQAPAMVPAVRAAGVLRLAADPPGAPRGRNLFRDIAGDLGAVLTSRDSLVIAGYGLGGSGLALLLDDEVAQSGISTEVDEGGFLDGFFEPADLLGSAIVQVGGPIAMYGIGHLADASGMAELGRDLIRAQAVTQAFTQAVKVATQRTRPDGAGNTAFPSGHTSSAFAMASVLQRRHGWRAGIPAFAFSTWVAASRLNEERHWLSDLPFGAALGILVGRTVTRDGGPSRISPLVVPGGAGLVVSLGTSSSRHQSEPAARSAPP
jgi:hypothetical protein